MLADPWFLLSYFLMLSSIVDSASGQKTAGSRIHFQIASFTPFLGRRAHVERSAGHIATLCVPIQVVQALRKTLRDFSISGV